MPRYVKRSRASYSQVVGNTSSKISGAPANAQVSLNPAGTNNNLILRSVHPGLRGNNFAVEILDPGAANSTFLLSMRDRILTIRLATDENGDVVTTTQDVINAINWHPTIGAAILAIPGEGTVTGVLAGVSKTLFTGGTAPSGIFSIPWTHFNIGSNSENFRYTANGSDPSASSGNRMVAGDSHKYEDTEINYRAWAENLRMIREGANDANADFEFYSI